MTTQTSRQLEVANRVRLSPAREKHLPFTKSCCSPAIEYVLGNGYPSDLVKDRKRAVRKRAATLTAEQGEVFVQRKGRRVKVVTSVEEQRFILKACHSNPTSSHFGVRKTWQKVRCHNQPVLA